MSKLNIKLIIAISALLISFSIYAGGSDEYVNHNEPAYNGVGLFLGTTNSAESTDFSYGFEYVRYFNNRIGIKSFLEHTPTSGEGRAI